MADDKPDKTVLDENALLPKDESCNSINSEPTEGSCNTASRKPSRKRKRMRLTLTNRKNVKSYSCTQCKAVFSRQRQLDSHHNAHLDGANKELQCEECKISFSSSMKLLRHKQTTHGYVLTCELCGNTFSHIMGYKVHMRVHVGDKPFECNECDAKFTQSAHLSIHKRTHTGEKPYQCDQCKQCFKQISHLRSHERIHTQDRAFACDYCDAAFIQKSSLKRHSRIHTGERPYVCEVCGAAFCVRNNLNRHMQRHSGQHPFECYCGATFTAGFDLKRHEMAHKGLKPFSCTICPATFSRKANLKWHQLTHTGEAPFKCDKCPAEFMKPKDLRKHNSSHVSVACLNCEFCEESFTKKDDLVQHALIHKEQKGTCHLCKKTFSTPSCLKRHRLKHFKTATPQCTVCKATFADAAMLAEHGEQCGREIVTPSEPANNIADLEIVQSQVCQPITYIQVPITPSNPIQNTVPCVDQSIINNLPASTYMCDSNGYITVTNQGPAIILGGQSESMIVARPSLNCPNIGSHVALVNNNQVESWCFCNSISTLPPSHDIPTVETVTLPQQSIECVKYLPAQAFQTDLDIRGNISQPLVLGTLNVEPVMADLNAIGS